MQKAIDVEYGLVGPIYIRRLNISGFYGFIGGAAYQHRYKRFYNVFLSVVEFESAHYKNHMDFQLSFIYIFLEIRSELHFSRSVILDLEVKEAGKLCFYIRSDWG